MNDKPLPTGWPSVDEIFSELVAIQANLKASNDPKILECDVRLQVSVDSGEVTWAVHSGDASYDQDHRGFWGASSINIGEGYKLLRECAKDLQSQAVDDWAMTDCPRLASCRLTANRSR